MTEDEIATVLAELVTQAYRGKQPPTAVLMALGTIVRMASKSGTVTAPKKRMRKPKRQPTPWDDAKVRRLLDEANGMGKGNGAAAPE